MARKMGLNDELNLKGLIHQITSFFKNNGILLGPETTSKFLEILLFGIEKVDVSEYSFLQDGVKPRKRGKNKNDSNVYNTPKVSDIQKVLSGNVTLDKLELFSKLVHVGAYDEVFRKNIRPLVLEIERNDLIKGFCDTTDKMISPRYFSEEEYSEVQTARKKKDYTSYILVLLKHAFSYLENIPAYYAQRVYEQAETFDYDSPSRYALMREAADNGIVEACIELANYLAKRDDYSKPLNEEEKANFEEALHYFLVAREYDPALWNIGFILENYDIPKKTVSHINKVLRINSKIKDLDPTLVATELDVIRPSPTVENPSAVILAYKIQFFLAFKKDHFAKSLNSMGNMLYRKIVVIDEAAIPISAEQLIEKYRNLAANEQDLFAITNLGSNWVKKLLAGEISYENKPQEFLRNMQLLDISANAQMKRGLYNRAVAEYYILTEFSSEIISDLISKRRVKISALTVREHLLEAKNASMGNTQLEGELFYRLGMLESGSDVTVQTNFFNQAAERGQPDAIYEVALRRYLQEKHDTVVLTSLHAQLCQVVGQINKKKADAFALISQIESILPI